MRSTDLLRIAAAMACLSWTGAAQAQNGLSSTTAPVWPQWQGRLAVGLAHSPTDPAAGSRPNSLSLLGDYYFHRYTAGLQDRTSIGGFRATSGILLGGASPRLLSGWGGSLAPSRFSLSRQSLGQEAAAGGPDMDAAAIPYIGLGYTSISLSGGWGFSADIGLSSSTNGRRNTAWGRPATFSGNGLGLEDSLREMRLSPLLHLGVSYSF